MNKQSKIQLENDDFELEAFVPFQLAVVANRLNMALLKIVNRKYELRTKEWRMLTTLERFQPCSALKVAKTTSMDPARVSRAQTKLVKLGLVQAVTDVADRRRVVLSLTPLGQELIDELTPEALQTEEWLLGKLSCDERQQFKTIMDKLFTSTDEERRHD
jgi:DNA-binding MarR family transcriptional regulator